MTPGSHLADDRKSVVRVYVVAGVLALLFAIIIGRAAHVALGGGADQALAPQARAISVAPRADIVDRRGDLLATSVPSWSLAADPGLVWDPADAARRIAGALPGLDEQELARRLGDRSRRFVWVQRGLTPKEKEAAFALGLEGLRFEEGYGRIYPGGRLAGHLLGYANIDGVGADGVERAFDLKLASESKPLRLTIDSGVQFALEDELERAASDFIMKGASGIVMDAHSGAIRAMASWPFLDPNQPRGAPTEARTNRALGAVYELGSIYKPLTVAAALDVGVISAEEVFDVSEPLKIGRTQIRDLHPLERASRATVTDILAESSNIGVAMIARRLGVERHKAFLRRAGLLARPVYEGPAAAAPLTPAEWDPVTAATIAYGHGVAVSPLAFLSSFAAFANEGRIVEPVFIEPGEALSESADKPGEQIMSPETAGVVVAMMRRAVTHGTGRNADAEGFEVAGKTGTAEKPGPDGYDPERNVTSFAALFPASRPQFVVLIVLDEAEPRSGHLRTAGFTSAAIAGRLIARAAPMLGVDPVAAPTIVQEAREAALLSSAGVEDQEGPARTP